MVWGPNWLTDGAQNVVSHWCLMKQQQQAKHKTAQRDLLTRRILGSPTVVHACDLRMSRHDRSHFALQAVERCQVCHEGRARPQLARLVVGAQEHPRERIRVGLKVFGCSRELPNDRISFRPQVGRSYFRRIHNLDKRLCLKLCLCEDLFQLVGIFQRLHHLFFG